MPYLSNAVILSEINSKGDELWSGGQIIHTHEQVQYDCHGVCVDEHGFVAVVLRDVVQQAQCHLLKCRRSHQLHCLQAQQYSA